MKKIYLESLGCARNQVDSEIMLGRLVNDGWSITKDPADAAVIVVNTCSFVESAADESIDTILEFATYKKKGKLKRLIVAGCLPERYREDIVQALPEVDQFLGTGAFDKITRAVMGETETVPCLLPDPDAIPVDDGAARRTTQSFAAYLKIAEGCSRHCTYCIIPKLRGKQKSRPMDRIVEEAHRLVRQGVKELTLVSQDTTRYGEDLSGSHSLDRLLERLSGLSKDIWIRFLYGHPESIADQVIQTVGDHDNICSYFDLPVQHAATGILRKMGRQYDKKDLLSLFDRIRANVPGAALRTTLITGFPGETEDDFRRLLNFVKTVQFDHLGVFTYSDANDLPSHSLPDHVPEKVAVERRDSIMAEQMNISARHTEKQLGKKIKILVESSPEEDLFIGRSALQAPEVDGITYIRSGSASQKPVIGTFSTIKITDATEYDLTGDAI